MKKLIGKKLIHTGSLCLLLLGAYSPFVKSYPDISIGLYWSIGMLVLLILMLWSVSRFAYMERKLDILYHRQNQGKDMPKKYEIEALACNFDFKAESLLLILLEIVLLRLDTRYLLDLFPVRFHDSNVLYCIIIIFLGIGLAAATLYANIFNELQYEVVSFKISAQGIKKLLGEAAVARLQSINARTFPYDGCELFYIKLRSEEMEPVLKGDVIEYYEDMVRKDITEPLSNLEEEEEILETLETSDATAD